MTIKTKVLYIQKENGCSLSSEAATYIEAIDQNTWLTGEHQCSWLPSNHHSYQLSEKNIGDIIPVGSVEFVQDILTQVGLPPLQAINIPTELNDLKYLS